MKNFFKRKEQTKSIHKVNVESTFAKTKLDVKKRKKKELSDWKIFTYFQ